MSDLNGNGNAMIDLLAAEAQRRDALHAGNEQSVTQNFIGLTGEAEFARTFGLPLDLQRRIGGDGGVDFIVPLRFTVDVKTARTPTYLICEEGKVIADIYVLASYDDETRDAKLLGWEWGAALKRAPVRDFGLGVVSHYIERGALKKMADFGKRMMRLT